MQLDEIKSRIANGTRIDPQNPRVVDIGGGLIAKYGTYVSDVEVAATNFVATFTSIRVPKIIAHASEIILGRTVTYIIQERLPGVPLSSCIDSLDASSCDDIARQLVYILSQLAALNEAGPIGQPGRPHCLHRHVFGRFRNPCTASSTKELVAWVAAQAGPGITPAQLAQWSSTIDFSRPPIFSHGDLVPENIMVERRSDGKMAITGIIDWEAAGWYPYFWNDFVTRRTLQFDPDNWARIAACMLKFPEEGMGFMYIYHYADLLGS